MNIQQHLEINKVIEQQFIEYLDDDENVEENYNILIILLNDNKIKEDQFKVQEILYLISNVSNNHQRTSFFFFKIEKLLLFFKKEMKENMSNIQIYKLFKSNKRILLFLFEEKILTVDQQFIEKKSDDINYQAYFYNEYKDYIPKTAKTIILKLLNIFEGNDTSAFERKRKIGENHNFICQLIRNDSIEEFIIYVNKNNFVLTSTIGKSLYETNPFLLKKKPKLIEYSAFFGSSQIFKYLYMNGCDLTPSLWLYAIHGNNPEIINILEENKIIPEDESYRECLNESIKCHHFSITDYILQNYFNNDINQHTKSIKYSNFAYFPHNLQNNLFFYELCRYNYIWIVKYLINKVNININAKINAI